MDTPRAAALTLHPDDGRKFEWSNECVTVKLAGEETDGSYTLVEVRVASEFTLPLHVHRNHAETFFILEGELDFRLGDRRFQATAGSTIHVPAGVPHAAVVTDATPQMLMMYCPAGFENDWPNSAN